MSHSPKAALVFSLLAAGSTALNAQCSSYACSQCFSNMSPLPGHGPSNDGRRIIFVYIDSTWGNPTNNTIYNATNIAINEWNAAIDASCGAKTAYFLQLNQAGGSGQADIIIKRDDFIGTCGQNNVNTPQYAPHGRGYDSSSGQSIAAGRLRCSQVNQA
jgi:hypothetical protein